MRWCRSYRDQPPADMIAEITPPRDTSVRKSVGGAAAETKAPKKSAKKPRKAVAGQKEMLMPIAGKKQAKETAAKKPAARSQRKSA